MTLKDYLDRASGQRRLHLSIGDAEVTGTVEELRSHPLVSKNPDAVIITQRDYGPVTSIRLERQR